MKLKLLIILLILFYSMQVWANETNRNQISSAPESSRFEIIQSELAAKVTLKIDKYTGRVYQLVQGHKGLTWQIIQAEKHNNDVASKGRVNYQVFTSGLVVRMTYLLNVNTGSTWKLAEDKKIGKFWAVLE